MIAKCPSPLHVALIGLAVAGCAGTSSGGASSPATHRFAIGERDFLLDGQPFADSLRRDPLRPRAAANTGGHRLQLCKAMGLNTVCAYLFWNYHEWNQGRFDWSGQADAAEFCRLAQAGRPVGDLTTGALRLRRVGGRRPALVAAQE